MANRYPLILDTTDGNKIKELPEGDNLYLRTNSITGVQNIDALGTINAADITIGGQRLIAQSILDLTDTPSSFSGQANQLLKVSSDETSIDFVSLSDIGDITAGNITITGGILPDVDGVGSIGSDGEQFNEVRALDLYGNLRGYDGTLIFNASANAIPYAAIAGGPTSLSEFINDTGYVTQAQVDATLASGITISDFKGSVFGDDSTLLVDAVASRINPAAVYGELGGPISVIEVDTPTLISTNYLTITTEGDLFTQVIDIEPGGVTSEVNITSPNITITGNINNRLTLVAGLNSSADITAPTFTGEFIGSVFADDSTIVFDGTDGKLKSPTISGTATFEENIIIQGNLTVQGTTTSVETTNTTITDNIIVLNQGESGAGVTAGTSGIEVDRGSQPNASFVYDDAIDKWSTSNSDLRVRNIDTASGDIDGFTNITGAAGGDITQFTNITGDSGGTISGFTTITGDSGGDITGFTNITGDSGGTISQFTDITGDSGGTISQFTDITGDSGGTISQFTNITGDSGGDITQFTNITGDTGGTISQFLNITGDGTGTISGFSDITGDGNGTITDFPSITDVTNIDFLGTGYSVQIDEGGNFYLLATSTDSDITIRTNQSGFGQNDFVFGKDGTLTLPGPVIGLVGDLIGDVKGSVFGDDSTILVDAVNNRFIGTLVGNIIGDMTGDPVLTLSTPGDNPGEIINIAPGGSANFVNLVADTIRFFGDTTAQNDLTVLGTLTTTTFVGTGDLIGSVFADDSTKVVDGLDGSVYANKLRTSEDRIALGSGAGETGQGIVATAVGYQAGQTNQGIGAVAIGDRAGSENQTLGAVAIGNLAGIVDQGLRGVAIGSVAGNDNQGQYGIAIGYGAASVNQGEYSVAIGYQAGAVNQTANSVVINGGSTGVLAPEEGFYIAPVRNVEGGAFLTYNTSTKEVGYSSRIDGDLVGSVFADDSTLLVDAVNGEIPGYVKIADLKTALQDGAGDYAAFKAWILANL